MAKDQKPIRIKPANRGKLHKDLGVKQGKKISSSKLSKAKKNPDVSTAEKKRIVFAQNAKKWSKNKKK